MLAMVDIVVRKVGHNEHIRHGLDIMVDMVDMADILGLETKSLLNVVACLYTYKLYWLSQLSISTAVHCV